MREKGLGNQVVFEENMGSYSNIEERFGRVKDKNGRPLKRSYMNQWSIIFRSLLDVMFLGVGGGQGKEKAC